MSAIHCHQLCKTFHQGDEIITGLDHVDITIESGEFVCLSGPSGSGKTTLLNAIGGLDTPDSGEIRMGDLRIDQLERGALADMRLHHIGFVFQAYNLIAPSSPRSALKASRTVARHSYPGVSSSASRSHAPSFHNPTWFWPTNPPPTSTASPRHT